MSSSLGSVRGRYLRRDFQTVNIDLSEAGGGKLTVEVKGSVGEGGTIEGNVGLSANKSSFHTTT